MRKTARMSFLALFSAAFLCVSGGLFSSIRLDSPFVLADDGISYTRPSDVTPAPEAGVPAVSPAGLYLIREQDGRIAIYAEGETDKPYMTLDVYVFTLPEAAAEELYRGIYCDGADLHRYIAAYTS